MRRELDYFRIGKAYGGNQEWFAELMMREGGCAAATACESCIYLARTMGRTYLYPYKAEEITREDYVAFGSIMKPYLHPRITGIDTLQLFMDGFSEYLRSVGEERLDMFPFEGTRSFPEAKEAVIRQIDSGYPIPMLLLKHKKPELEDYVWHWFMLTGYQVWDGCFYVKAVTFGEFEWLSLEELWDTGFERKGGLILYAYRD